MLEPLEKEVRYKNACAACCRYQAQGAINVGDVFWKVIAEVGTVVVVVAAALISCAASLTQKGNSFIVGTLAREVSEVSAV